MAQLEGAPQVDHAGEAVGAEHLPAGAPESAEGGAAQEDAEGRRARAARLVDERVPAEIPHVAGAAEGQLGGYELHGV